MEPLTNGILAGILTLLIMISIEVKKMRKARNRCKGSYDYNVTLYKRLNMEPEKYMKNYIEVF